MFCFHYSVRYVVECIHYKYGLDCSQSCGHCTENKQCHHINGVCPFGCDPGYMGVQCTRSMRFFIYLSKIECKILLIKL